MSYIYLASPYWHEQLEVRERRYREACLVAGELMKAGLVVFSPIAHSHSVATYTKDMPTTWDFWKTQDEVFLRAAKRLVILELDGWRESVGVQAEFEIAKQCKGMAINFIKLSDDMQLHAGRWRYEHEQW